MKRIAIEALVHVVLIVAVFVALYPVLWVIAAALSPGDAPDLGAIPIPRELSLEHVRALVGTSDDEGRWLFGIQLANSIVIALATAIVSIAIATPAAYALARFDFVGAKEGTRVLLATQMFPGVAASIPLYLLLHYASLLDTRTGLILVYSTTAVPFAVFQLRGAFEGIPRDLEEAAMVDGATRIGAFVRVVLPAARPALAVTALFAFMSAWNEFVLAATFMTSETSYTMPVVLSGYVGEYDAQLGTFAAGAILVSVPVMLLFYALQRHLVSGLTSGGVKG